MKRSYSLLLLSLLALLCVGGPLLAADEAVPAEPDKGDTAWMLVSTAFVMLMVPGLALFYGGLVRSKNVLGTMMHSMVALALIGIQWVLVGYCFAFGDSLGGKGILGWNPDYLGLAGVLPSDLTGTIPVYLHCMYQGMFAIITPALISGAFAERIRFGPYCVFILLWALLVYNPLAHWVWGPGGWLLKLGALDFAGGTVVHIAAGVSGLAAILVLRKRLGFPEHAMHPNGMALSLLGAGLLWFGWFGFNGGSGLGSGTLAASAFSATQVAAAAAGLTWVLVEWQHRGKPTALGLATGIVAGLVAVTPAAGYVSPVGGLLIGVVAGLLCYVVVVLKPFFQYDDSLDAFGVHGVGGLLGALLTGVLASSAINPAGVDGSFKQFGIQLVACLAAIAFSFVVTAVLVKVIDLTMGFCLTPEAEGMGLDRAEHGETGFDFGVTLGVAGEAAAPEPRPAMVPPDGHNRFTVVLEGSDVESITRAWTDLCQAGTDQPPPPEFRNVYPYLTTVQGNRFRFRNGDPSALSAQLERLLGPRLGGRKVSARVES